MITKRFANFIRVCVTKLQNGGKLKIDKLEMRKNSSIKISVQGRIVIDKLLLNENAFLCCSDHGVIEIGRDVSINRNSIIVSKESIVIGNNTSIGPNVCIYDHDHDYDESGFKKSVFKTAPVIIGENVWIGANVTILRGSRIGNNCIIGANTLIKGEIPESTIATSKGEIRLRPIK